MRFTGHGTMLIRGGGALVGLAILTGTAVCGSDAVPKQAPPIATEQANPAGSNGNERPPDQSGLQQRNPRYELSKSDIFDLTFPLTPEFNQTVTVQPDGYITLNGLGDLHVAGKTIPEVRELVQTAYAKILHDPIINIVLRDFQKAYFIVGGEISHPGKFELRNDVTVTEAVALAGGFTEDSKHSQVLLFRRVSADWVEVKTLDVKKMFASGNLAEDSHLQPGDMVFVPKSRYGKIKKFIPYPSLGMFMSPTF